MKAKGGTPGGAAWGNRLSGPVCGIAAACVIFHGAAAAAQSGSFYDTFETLDESRWFISDGWNNGDWHGCTWSRKNVEVGDGILIEILGKSPRAIQANYYADGEGGNEKLIPLGLDLSASMQDYAFVWAPEALRWYLNGELLREVTDSAGPLPVTQGKLFISILNGQGTDMEG